MKNSKIIKTTKHHEGLFAETIFIFLLTIIPFFVFSQTKTITGNIVDANEDPIIGATIMVKGTTIGTISDTNGNFILNNVPENAVIQISYIGYSTQEIPVIGKTSFKIVLQEETQTLEEVIVVGYGVQKKSTVSAQCAEY